MSVIKQTFEYTEEVVLIASNSPFEPIKFRFIQPVLMFYITIYSA